MIKKLCIVAIILIALPSSYAQQGTASPYSYYGVGVLKFKGTVENRSMGGLSIYNDSIHINIKNPAGYTGKNLLLFNKETRPVKFTVGGSYSSIDLKTETEKENISTTTFDYLAVSVPIGKFGVGIGLLPYTSVGYKLETFTSSNDVANRYTGSGGVNKVFMGAGYQINDDLRAGIEASYNFGSIESKTIAFLYHDDGELTEYQTREDNRSDLSGIGINIGLSYKKMINDKLELFAGFTYAPESSFTSKNTRSYTSITINSVSGQEFDKHEVIENLEAKNLAETDLKIPSKLSLGTGIGKPKKWFIGTEFTYTNSSRFSNPFFGGDNVSYIDGAAIAIGGFYIPKHNSFSNYLKRIVYRAGMRYENTGLEINNEKINEFGISFGVGLPVGGLFSNANIGFEYGRRGTTNQSLVQENFLNFQLSLSLNDRWFQKRKYN